jgi:MoxR-like ATPase
MPVTSKPVTSTDIQKISTEMNNTHYERKDAIQAALLALLSGEHLFLLGPPGTAKSALARDLADRLVGSRYFETLLSRTRPAEAVLGPLDLPKLRDSGAFVRKSDGFSMRLVTCLRRLGTTFTVS